MAKNPAAVALGRKGGQATSEKKAAAARRNGAKGGRPLDCWGRCPACDRAFTLGCVVPCPLEVYIAALKAARCPQCGTKKGILAYEPGRQPEARRRRSQTPSE